MATPAPFRNWLVWPVMATGLAVIVAYVMWPNLIEPAAVPTPSASSASPSPTPEGEVTPTNDPTELPQCLAGDPTVSGPETDGSLTGGRLLLAPDLVPGRDPITAPMLLATLNDVQGVATEDPEAEGQQFQFVVGEHARDRRSATPREAVVDLMGCVIDNTTAFPQGITSFEVINETLLAVDGHAAAQLEFTAQSEPTPIRPVDGDRIVILVVDDGRENHWSVAVWSGRSSEAGQLQEARDAMAKLKVVN